MCVLCNKADFLNMGQTTNNDYRYDDIQNTLLLITEQ